MKRLLIMLLLSPFPVLANITELVFGTPSPIPGIWVDSVAGSDSNNGTSNAPFATIAKAETYFAPGTNLWLKANSHWREQLDVDETGMVVSRYGAGANPLLDASDIITGSWSNTTGNVWEKTVTWDSAVAWLNVYENSNALVWASSVANCAATPGTYNVSSQSSSPTTIYVHATGSGNPGSNGKTYEYTKRGFGLDGKPYDGPVISVTGVNTRRNACRNGSIQFQGIWNDIVALDGSKHNALWSGASRLTNVICGNAYYPVSEGVGILFVGNQDTVAGLTGIYDHCSATNATLNSNLIGWYAHVNVSGGFSNIYHISCTATNLNQGISPGGTNNNIVLDGAIRCNYAIESSAVRMSVTNTVLDGLVSAFQADGDLTTTNVLSGCTLTSGSGNVVYAIDAANVAILGCTFSGSAVKVNALNTGARLRIFTSTFGGSGINYQVQNTTQTTSDNNSFAAGTTWSITGLGSRTFAQWKSDTSQDASSTNP